MKSRYRKTFAGFIWVVINPIIMYGVQSLVFRKFLRLEISNFFTFLLAGLLPWVFINQTIQMTTPLLCSQGQLLKAMRIHPLVILTAQIFDNFINFVFAFLILFVPVLLTEGTDPAGFVFLPLGILIFIAGVMGMSLFLSVFNVFYRDTQFVVGFVMSVMFFATPIFYPIEFIPQQYLWIVHINPFYGLIQTVRTPLYHFSIENVLNAFQLGVLWAAGFLFLSLMYWKKKKGDLLYHV